MNFNMHPDMVYELNKLDRLERLETDSQPRPFPDQLLSDRSLKERALLLSGDLFISLGKNLKGRAVRQVCEPQTV